MLFFFREYEHQMSMAPIPGYNDVFLEPQTLFFVGKYAYHTSLMRMLVKKHRSQGFLMRILVREDGPLGFQSFFLLPQKKALGRQTVFL